MTRQQKAKLAKSVSRRKAAKNADKDCVNKPSALDVLAKLNNRDSLKRYELIAFEYSGKTPFTEKELINAGKITK